MRFGPANDSPRYRHGSDGIIIIHVLPCETGDCHGRNSCLNFAYQIPEEDRLAKYIIVLFLALIVAGGVFLATWDIPAPTESVEKTIPNDRFPR